MQAALKRSRSVSDISRSVSDMANNLSASSLTNGRSGFLLGCVLLGRHIEGPRHCFARGSHRRRHAQPVVLETAVRLAGAVDHLDHHDRLLAHEITSPQRAIRLIVIKA